MNGTNLSVYDFIVDIIPGVFAVLLVLSVLPASVVGGLGVTDLTLGSSVLIVVFGYFVGHLVQAVASPVDDWVYFRRHDGYPFERKLAEADDDSVPDRFKEHVDPFFAVDPGEEFVGGERFKLTQSYLWNHDLGRAQRFQVLYTFLRSMWMLLIVGAVLHIVAAVVAAGTGHELVWTLVQSVVIVVGLVVTGVVSYWRRLHYQEMMVDALIYDLYANVLSQPD